MSVSEIAATGEWNEEKRREIGKNLREKHTLECVEHENELRAEEIKVNFVLNRTSTMQLEPAHLISPIVSCLKLHGILHVKAFVDRDATT